MQTEFKATFNYKVIYVFTIPDEAHKGLLKIGDATLHTNTPIDQLLPNSHELNQCALERIRSYTNTAGITPKLLHTELAIRTIKDEEGNLMLKAFRDHQVHNVLKNSGINNVPIGDATGKEWFYIDLDTARKAIDAVKNNYANLSNTSLNNHHTPIIFRPEQEDCINKVVNHFEKADRFLINAKMRYGKTFVALEIVKRCAFEKTIILTHRPVVDAGWYDDFTKIFHDSDDTLYGSKATGYALAQLLKTKKKFIYFASIQDLRGSVEVGGKFDKNDEIFDTVWDCVIVDEAHEGTTTALGEETVKAVVKEGQGTKFLALSGTPFNIVSDYEEKSIYTWDYVMEQECKYEWNKNHFGDPNPYDELPELRIYTYSLGDILHNENYITYEDKAFNFKEFFRTFTGDFSIDHDNMPPTAKEGDFVHEADVWSFLNLMTKEDPDNQYPFTNEKYRDLFKHTLWMVPGVKEARALKALMMKHPIFGCGQFDIVNVAGAGDEEEKYEEALRKVKAAIKAAKKSDTYTITLSCGKLTTGVTVKEWTAVFMLAGAYSTSAANYLQTIFRVQSPCNDDGKIKETAYVFDFAPDRTLKMITSAVQISARAGKTTDGDKQVLGKFLNYCPVIAISGSEMKPYNTNKLLQQLKRAYADRAVRHGFDDTCLYNDELLKLDQLDLKKFEELKKIIGKTPAMPKTDEIDVNKQGLTNEEYEEQKKLKKKPEKDLTPEEQERLEELKEKKKVRKTAISVLRGISIRMPLLIYGADIPYDEEITLDRFVDAIDISSWEEFMPNGVTKEMFKEFQKYYDEEVFIAAGRRIRNIAREADTLEPTERVKKIASLFSTFKNPDKETVLTPWRVVNMHMADTLGGWCFYDETFEEDHSLSTPRFVDQGQVTKDVFENPNTQILEINSKTGLYPLYVAYSVYRCKLEKEVGHKWRIAEKNKLWQETIDNNVFVICKTKMAKAITQRTLLGYHERRIKAHWVKELVNVLKNKPHVFEKRVLKKRYWKMGDGLMEFDAIVGNPPYQLLSNGGANSGKAAKQAPPIFQFFVQEAKALSPKYISMIIMARWYNGGMGLNTFRTEMVNDKHLTKLVDFANSKDCFTSVDIGGGICYFLWERDREDDCIVVNYTAGKRNEAKRPLNEFESLFVRSNQAVSIIKKIQNQATDFVASMVSPIDTFGIPSKTRGHEKYQDGDILLIHSDGTNNSKASYISRDIVKKNANLIDKYKVRISILVPQNGEAGVRPEKGYRSISTPHIVYPGQVDSFSYLNIGFFDTENEAENFRQFMMCKLPRFLMRTTYSSSHVSRSNFIFVPKMDFTRKWSDKDLYTFFNLSNEEIDIVEKIMRPMKA